MNTQHPSTHSTIRTIRYVNGICFLGIVFIVILKMNTHLSVPAKPFIDLSDHSPPTPSPSVSGDDYKSLGAVPIFNALIPKPTPAPTPIPSPTPGPNLQSLVSNWKLTGLLPGGRVNFEDAKSNEEWEMTVGEIKAVQFQGAAIDVKLKSIDEMQVWATFSFTDRTGEHTCCLKMGE